METAGWLSILPPVVAILLAIRTKQVYISLFFGIWLGWLILSHWNPVVGTVRALDACVGVFADASNTKVILFSALVGALIALTQYSGGVRGFVDWVVGRGLVRGKKQAGFLAWLVGMLVFVESSISILVAGSVARPLFDRLRISREKLAYICDSTSAPTCILIPLNAWGAFVIGLLMNEGVENPVGVMLSAMPLNFYAFLAIFLVLFTILSGRDVGPMRFAEQRVRETGRVLREGVEPLMSAEVVSIEAKPGVPARPLNMLAPIFVMVAMMPAGLLITGRGNLMNGSGSTSVFWAVLAGIFVGALMYRMQKLLTLREIMYLFIRGVSGLIPLAMLMLFAFAIGETCRQLGTGVFVASVAKAALPVQVIPALLFLVSGFIAFSTGTSWGTFAIMIPIGIPMVSMMGLHAGVVVGAILGGGVFGDHCSPISDTTIIASMASATDHIDHVRTQLPYALMAAGTAVVLYLFIGVFRLI